MLATCAPACRLAAPAPQRPAFGASSSSRMAGTAGVAHACAPAPRRRRSVVARVAEQTRELPGSLEALSLPELRGSLQEAVAAEDYSMAAALRDKIQQLEAADPEVQAERERQAVAAELATAVEEERFQDAARLRDRLKELQPAPPPPSVPEMPDFDPTAPTTSSTVTDGVRVTCRSFYVPAESRPASNSFFFGYQITIQNEGTQTVKLMERYWHITNGSGQSQEVRGPGVVGEQPELGPGESFTYQSACPLRTPSGCMEGHYEFYSKDEVSGQWTKSFLVKIGQFNLQRDS